MTGLALIAASAALGASYPAVLDAPSITAWLRQSRDVAPEQVVAVGPSAVTAIIDRLPGADGRFEVRLRALALTPAAASRSGVAAWEMPLQVECRTGEVRAGATTGYPSRGSRDDEITLTSGEASWRKPAPGTALAGALRAVCDPGFRPPLGATTRRIAEAAKAAPRHPAAAPVRSGAASTADGAARDTTAPPPARAAGAQPRRGRRSVQVVSSPVQAETRQTLARLKRRYGGTLEGFETRVEQAQVQGRTVYRGVFAGFASRSDALGFCKTLQQAGQACLAR